MCVAGAMLAATLSADAVVNHQPAYAGGTVFNYTCAQLNSSAGGASQTRSFSGTSVNVTLQPGDVLSLALAAGSPHNQVTVNNNGSSSTVTVPTEITNSTNAQVVVMVSRAPGLFDPANVVFTCSTGSGSDISTGEIQSSLTPLIMNSQNENIHGSTTDAASSALQGNGNGSQFGFVNETGFSLSTRGLQSAYGLRDRVNKETKDLVYGSTTSLSDVTYDSPWNIWASGNYNRFDGKASLDGYVAGINAGADYLVDETTVVGALLGYSNADLDVSVNSTPGSLASNAFTVGVYAGKRLDGGVIANGYVAYTRSDYDVLAGTTTGSYNANRFSVGGQVHGSTQIQGLEVQPTLSGFYGREVTDSYVDSTGSTVASQTISAGRLSLGPKILFATFTEGNAVYAPYLAAYADYDFSNVPVTSSTLPNIDSEFSASVELGVSIKLGDTDFKLSGRAGGLGSNEYSSYSGRLDLRIPLQ